MVVGSLFTSRDFDSLLRGRSFLRNATSPRITGEAFRGQLESAVDGEGIEGQANVETQPSLLEIYSSEDYFVG